MSLLITRLDEIGHNIAGVRGDIAEIGVFQGETFRHLVRLAEKLKRKAHAFDSFNGMNEPGVYDSKDYPKGRFSIGGVANFHKLMQKYAVNPNHYEAWEGFIPDCFTKFLEYNGEAKFSLVFVDVDHYHPTFLSIAWVQRKISKGGFLVLDDYLPDVNSNFLATRAIDFWLQSKPPYKVWANSGGQLILRRY